MLKKRRTYIIAATLLAVIVIYYQTSKDSQSTDSIFVPAEVTDMVVSISTTGEIEAKNSVEIDAPVMAMRKANIWETTIADIITEGTVVKAGDFVAQLSTDQIGDQIKNYDDAITKGLSELMQGKIDTALTLRQDRDNIINLRYSVEEAKIKLEQSAYEPPATIKQAKMDVTKATRTLEQETHNYLLKVSQAEAKISDIRRNHERTVTKRASLLELQGTFTIKAPEDGMLIYAKDRGGTKKKVGTQVAQWDKTVATLPDLSSLVSRTYINEVDIRKISKGQPVELGMDAFPDKKLTGAVIGVANVGEQKPNSDAKVFEVLIEIKENDPLFRPGMTTSNTIITEKLEQVLTIPIEALNSQGDSITFVYIKSGLSTIKQEVTVGSMNDYKAVVTKGISSGDLVSLSPILGKEDDKIETL